MTARGDALVSVRALAMLSVVAGHAALSFLETPIGWAVRDRARWLGADAAVWTIRQFAMPTFFFIGGIAAAALWQRLGARGFVVHRARRLLLPLAVSLVPVSLAMSALWDAGRAQVGRDAGADAVPQHEASSMPITLAHLWFLYYLLGLTALAVVIALVVRTRPRWLARLAAQPAALLVLLTVPPWLGRIAVGGLQVDTPLGFVPDLASVVTYGAFFAGGWWWPARGEAAAALARWTPAFLAIIAVATAAVTPALLDSRSGAAPSVAVTGAAVVDAAALVLVLVGGAHRWLATPPRWLAWLAADNLWLYIVHLPVVVALQLGAAWTGGPGPLEYLAIIAVALAVSIPLARGLAFVAPRGHTAHREQRAAHHDLGDEARDAERDHRDHRVGATDQIAEERGG